MIPAEALRKPVLRPEIPRDFSVHEVRLAGNRGACGGVEMTLAVISQLMEIVPVGVTIWTTHMPVNFPPVFERYGDRLKNVNGNISQVPDGDTLVISAHGAPKEIYDQAQGRGIKLVDTSCPFVLDEHNKVIKAEADDVPSIFLGEETHPETIGVRGQVAPDAITVFDPSKPIPNVPISDGARVFAKTTNDPAQTEKRLEELRVINPTIDISEAHSCYALRNRFAAGKKLVREVDYWLVVGDETSHNAKGIRDISLNVDIPHQLVRGPKDIDWSVFGLGTELVGVSSAASVPEKYTQSVLDSFRALGVPIREMEQVIPEAYRIFRLPEAQIEILRQMYA